MAAVLIADDEDDIRLLLRSLFEQRGWVVEEAADGEAAADLSSGRDYDLLVLDQSMPGLTGLEVAKRARARHRARSSSTPRT